MTTEQPAKRMDDLNTDCVQSILRWLPVNSLLRVARTCHTLREAAMTLPTGSASAAKGQYCEACSVIGGKRVSYRNGLSIFLGCNSETEVHQLLLEHVAYTGGDASLWALRPFFRFPLSAFGGFKSENTLIEIGHSQGYTKMRDWALEQLAGAGAVHAAERVTLLNTCLTAVAARPLSGRREVYPPLGRTMWDKFPLAWARVLELARDTAPLTEAVQHTVDSQLLRGRPSASGQYEQPITMATLPAGTYWVGDPYYAIDNSEWKEFCCHIFPDGRANGDVLQFHGHPVWLHFPVWSHNGAYPSRGFPDLSTVGMRMHPTYPINLFAGNTAQFAILPLALVAPAAILKVLGRIVHFAAPVVCGYAGDFVFLERGLDASHARFIQGGADDEDRDEEGSDDDEGSDDEGSDDDEDSDDDE
jgi:hypothetical protein